MHTRIFIIATLLMIGSPVLALASGTNAGFVNGFWYSSSKFYADEPVRMYVALRNTTETDLTGTVVFKDNGKDIATKTVDALAGRLVEAWADWTPTYGNHTLSAILTKVVLHPVGGSATTTDVENALAKDTIFIDHPPPPPKPPTPTSTEEASSTNGDTAGAGGSGGHPNPSGLEQFYSSGPIGTTITHVTDAINATKQHLDAYRARQNPTGATGVVSLVDPGITQHLDEVSGNATSNGGDATITRTTVPKQSSFLTRVINAGIFIVKNIYSFLLAFASFILGFPALVELLVLIIILLTLIRFARKFARRPDGY